ncbi:LysR substrate-binding domain-containing protein [Rhizobium sp. PAMB 3182]
MKLPPLTHLRAFEAAARQQGFLQAAEELGVSAAAVSQHVRALEDWLGLPLFERRPRGVVLTAAGREFGAACSQGLGEIALAAEGLRRAQRQKKVSLACQASVVTHWLPPRLPRFRAAHPEIQVCVVYPLGARTPEEAGADLLIRHLVGADGAGDRILSAAVRPTCSPAYLERHGPIEKPKDLLDADLLHDETEAAWRDWFSLSGIRAPKDNGPIFEDFNLLVGSVKAGLGVGLCPTALVQEDVRRGNLCVLFETPGDADRSYWLIAAGRLSEEAAILRRWLLSEADAAATIL